MFIFMFSVLPTGFGLEKRITSWMELHELRDQNSDMSKCMMQCVKRSCVLFFTLI